MASYRVEIKRRAERDLRNLPASVNVRIWPVLSRLAETPRPRGVKKLSQREHAYRLRVGEHRVLYEVYDRERLVSVRRVLHRREAYR